MRLSDCQHSSIVPSGTDSSLKTLTQHFVLGYFRQVPAGLIFSNHQQTSAKDSEQQQTTVGMPSDYLSCQRGR